MRLRLFVVICFLLISLAGCARDQHKLSTNHTLTHREKKAHLVKKFLKKLKKQEGLIKLVDGRNEYEEMPRNKELLRLDPSIFPNRVLLFYPVPLQKQKADVEYEEGNVEIFHMGKWGSICDDEWDLREASVVCRQLGYDRPYRVTHSSMFGPARRRFWMDNLYCTGDEPDLSSCRFDGWGSNDCTASEAAGVMCVGPEGEGSSTETPSTTPSPLPKKPLSRIKEITEQSLKLRLTGGRVPEEGRVEVKFGDSDWGLVCGDGWSLFEAMVVCRQLGLGYANDAIQTDFFGGNASAMILSGVQCHGDEVDLSHCLHQEFGQVSCPGKRENIAAVVCTKALADLTIDHYEIMRTAHLEDRQLYFLQCAMEENCLASGAYKLQSDNSANWHLETRRLLRFTARIANIGTADFRPSIPKHLWEFHQCHMHYHSMEVFATFDVLDSNGVRVAEGHKASFCLEDNQCLPGVKPFYACANFGDQGISVNCSDIYRHNIDCQWVDISDLNPGLYTFKVSINPEFKVAEMTFDNNAAVCSLLYSESFAHIFNCSIQRP